MNSDSHADQFTGATTIVDASGLLCPQPLLRCREALAELLVGQQVHVIATDPHSQIDFEVFTRRTAHTLIAAHEDQGCYHFLIEKRL